MGIRAGVVTAKTGKAVDVRVLDKIDSDLLVISRQGQVIRLGLKGIPVIGRSTQGVRIMRMREGDKVASIAILPQTVEALESIGAEDKGSTSSSKKPPK